MVRLTPSMPSINTRMLTLASVSPTSRVQVGRTRFHFFLERAPCTDRSTLVLRLNHCRYALYPSDFRTPARNSLTPDQRLWQTPPKIAFCSSRNARRTVDFSYQSASRLVSRSSHGAPVSQSISGSASPLRDLVRGRSFLRRPSITMRAKGRAASAPSPHRRDRSLPRSGRSRRGARSFP